MNGLYIYICYCIIWLFDIQMTGFHMNINVVESWLIWVSCLWMLLHVFCHSSPWFDTCFLLFWMCFLPIPIHVLTYDMFMAAEIRFKLRFAMIEENFGWSAEDKSAGLDADEHWGHCLSSGLRLASVAPLVSQMPDRQPCSSYIFSISCWDPTQASFLYE